MTILFESVVVEKDDLSKISTISLEILLCLKTIDKKSCFMQLKINK